MKKCKSCNKELPLNFFSKRSSSKDLLEAKCKTCKSLAAKKYYTENNVSKKVLARNEKKKQLIIDLLLETLKTNQCIDCGINDIRVLEFDHVRGEKRFNLMDSTNRKYGLNTIKEEIAKCEIRCRNCHKIKTAKTNNTLYNKWYEKFLIKGSIDFE